VMCCVVLCCVVLCCVVLCCVVLCCVVLCCVVTHVVKVKLQFTLEQTTNAQRVSTGIALLFL